MSEISENLKEARKRTQFKKGDPNIPKSPGRPKSMRRRLEEILRDKNATPEEHAEAQKINGVFGGALTRDDWEQMMQGAMNLSPAEIEELLKDNTLSIGFLTFLGALKKGKDSFELSNFMQLFARKYGGPTNVTSVTGKIDVNDIAGSKAKLLAGIESEGEIQSPPAGGTAT